MRVPKTVNRPGRFRAVVEIRNVALALAILTSTAQPLYSRHSRNHAANTKRRYQRSVDHPARLRPHHFHRMAGPPAAPSICAARPRRGTYGDARLRTYIARALAMSLCMSVYVCMHAWIGRSIDPTTHPPPYLYTRTQLTALGSLLVWNAPYAGLFFLRARGHKTRFDR